VLAWFIVGLLYTMGKVMDQPALKTALRLPTHHRSNVNNKFIEREGTKVSNAIECRLQY